MLPNNFTSFMKKMVTSDGSGLTGSFTGGLAGAGGLSGRGLIVTSGGGVGEGIGGGAGFHRDYGIGGGGATDAGTALSKLRSTLTTGLQGTVTKLSSTRGGAGVANPPAEPPTPAIAGMGMSQEDRSLLQKVWDKAEKFEPGECKVKAPPIATPTAPTVSGMSPLSPNRRQDKDRQPTRPSRSPSTNCRVCVKMLSEGEFFKRCTECNLKVCEDCASYSSDQTNGEQNTWHCSICRRRLSSRARPPDPPPQDTTVAALPTKPSVSVPVLPTPGKPTALTLMSGFASVASSFASTPTPPQLQMQQQTQPLVPQQLQMQPPGKQQMNQPVQTQLHLQSYTTTTTATAQTAVPTITMNALSRTTMTTAAAGVTSSVTAAALGVGTDPRERRPSRSGPLPHLSVEPPMEPSQQQQQQQQQIHLQQSYQQMQQYQSQQRSPQMPIYQLQQQPTQLQKVQQQQLTQKQQQPMQLQQQQQAYSQPQQQPMQQQQQQKQLYTQQQQQLPQLKKAQQPIHQHQQQQIIQQQQQYPSLQEQILDNKDQSLDNKKAYAANNNTEVHRLRKTSQENEENATCSAKELNRSTSQLSCESSGDESRNEPGRRGRRRSIVRQKSYEEDVNEAQSNTFLTLWGTGGPLPLRRHSAQGPARREEALEAARKSRDSLDVPTRSQRHHSCDYDLPNQNLLIVSPSGGWQSSESDLSSAGPSEAGSVAAGLEDGRRYSRSSAPRHPATGYRVPGARNNDNTGDGSGYMALDSSPSPLSPDAPTFHADTPTTPKTPSILTSKASKGGETVSSRSTRRRETSSSLSLEDDNFLQPAEDEFRSTRRRSFTASEICRVLPTPPHSPRAAYSTGVTGGSSGSRGNASLESNTSLSVDDTHARRQSSVNDGEAIKIVIHDVETDQSRIVPSQEPGGRRRVTVHRDMSDVNSRSRGLGMRVVGGKPSDDGRLVAYVVWTVPTGPADNAGVEQGDKVLEWNNISLVDRSFEEVCSIIEQTTTLEVIDMLLETSSDMGVADYRDDGGSHRGSVDGWGSQDSEDKHGQSSSRRKLPRLPNDVTRGPVSGKIQLQLWFSSDSHSLVVTVISAHDLRPREGIAYAPPQAFVCLRLFPYGDFQLQSSSVSEPTFKPLWNNSFVWENISPDIIVGLTLELSVWDSVNEAESIFLGETLLDLRHAYLDDRPTWHRLQERRSRSANTTPRGSIAGQDFPAQAIRRSSVRSGNDEGLNNDSRHSSLDSGLLHPDLAWRDSRSNSRRGSSLSEQVECEVYQLSRQFPHSLPQSRRSSFACTPQSNTPDIKAVEELEDRLRLLPRPEERRRARSVKVASQSELLYEAGWRDPNKMPSWMSSSPAGSYNSALKTNLNRSLSLRGDQTIFQGSGGSAYRHEEDMRNPRADPSLGPCQVLPRGYREILADDITFGEILLELCLTKLHLEVIIGSAKDLPLSESGKPPDTYVKTYLKAGEMKLHKRKGRIVRASQNPSYHQTLRYHSTDALGRRLLLMIWENCLFSHNKCIGAAEINLAQLDFDKPVTGYYKLLCKTSVGRVDSESPESMG